MGDSITDGSSHPHHPEHHPPPHQLHHHQEILGAVGLLRVFATRPSSDYNPNIIEEVKKINYKLQTPSSAYAKRQSGHGRCGGAS
jgi:hypothetical protein